MTSETNAQQTPTSFSSADAAWWSNYLTTNADGAVPDPNAKGQIVIQKIPNQPGYYVDGYSLSGKPAMITVNEPDAIPQLAQILKKSPSAAGRWILNVNQQPPTLSGDGDLNTALYQRLQGAKDLCVPKTDRTKDASSFYDALCVVCATKGCNCGFDSSGKNPLIVAQSGMARSGPGFLNSYMLPTKPSDSSVSSSCLIQFYVNNSDSSGKDKYTNISKLGDHDNYVSASGNGTYFLPNGKRGVWAGPGFELFHPAPTSTGWTDRIKNQFCNATSSASFDDGNQNSGGTAGGH